MKQKFKIFLLLFAVFLFSCKKENMKDFYKGTGETITETRNISGFNTIYVEDKVNVFITESPTFEVKVECGEHLINLVKTELKDTVLKIRNDNKCNFMRSYKKGVINVYIQMPLTVSIQQFGQGTIQSTNVLTTPVIDVLTKGSGDVILEVNNQKVLTHMHNTSDIYLSGRTLEHDCYQIHYGFLFAKNLDTDYTWIFNNGTGNSYLKASNLLIATLRSAGDVYYYGNPGTVQKEVSGSGKLIAQ